MKILTAHPLFIKSRHIACYHSYGQEFDTKLIMNAIWQAGKICYLPILTEGRSLHFAQFDQGDELQPNQFLISEPVSSNHIIHPEKLDLVLVPLLAFDENGNRIGTGGGYYDRTFAYQYMKVKIGPFLLGVGYSCQKSNEIVPEPWDIKLQGVLTENELMLF